MKLNRRLLLGLALVCLALVSTPLVIYLVQSNRALQSARLEHAGIAPSKALLRLLRLLQQQRGLSAGVLSGHMAIEAQHAAKQIETQKEVEAFDAIVTSDIHDLKFVDVWRQAVEIGRGLANDVSSRSISGRESYVKHTALIEEHLKLLDSLVDYFGLSSDPYAHDYHLIMALLVHIPNLTEVLGQARARGMLLLAEKRITLVDRTGLVGLIANIERQHWYAGRELSKAIALDPQVEAELSDVVQKSMVGVQKAVDLARTQVVEPETLSYSPTDYFARFTQAIDGQFALADKGTVALEGVLQARITALRSGQHITLSLMALVAGLAVWLGMRAIRTTQRDIAALRQGVALRETIYKRSTLFSQSLELQKVYPAFAEAVKAFLPYDRISIIVPEGESLVAVLSVAEPPLQTYSGTVWHRRQDTAIEWVIAHKTPRMVWDLNTEQPFADDVFVAREGVRATLMVPLIAGGETAGAFVADSRKAGAYTDEHVELSCLMAEPLAVAIQNAGLYAQIARHAEALEAKVEERTRELRTVNTQLEAASRHKSNFLANMSHELRTPLNAILGFADLLREHTAGPLTAKQARYANHIHNSATHLLTLINDLLDLSKVEAGKLTLRIEPFALSEALAAAVYEIQPVADAKRLTIVLDVDSAPITLTADPVRFKQIIFNLLSNAIKFTPEGGRVTVTARRLSSSGPNPQPPDGDFVEIAITDTGIGIAAENLHRLFERFRQLETTKQSKGSGLGLALTKQLVELHRGTIAVTSAGLGHGSTFTVRLPLTPAADRGMGGEDTTIDG